MPKSHQVVVNSIFPLSANIAWFYASYYQRRISGSYSAPDIVFDVLFSIMMAVCLLIVFARNKTLYTKGAFKLKGQPDTALFLVKWAILLVLRGLLDVALPYLSGTLTNWSYLAVDWLIVGYWILVYLVAVKKNTAIWRNPKCLIPFLAVVIVLLGASFVYDTGLTQQYASLTEKYTEASPYLMRVSENFDFLNSVNAFVIDTVMVFALVLIHSIGAIQSTDSECAPSIRKIKRDQSIFRTFIRCDFIIAVVCIWAVVHMAVVPESSLVLRFNREGSSHTNFEVNGQFNETIIDDTAQIGLGTLTEEAACFYTKEMSLQKGDLDPQVFILNGSEPNLILTDTGERHSRYVKYTTEGTDVYLYDYYAICYYENGIPRIVRMEQLNNTARSPVLTALCKDLLADGNLFIFEYGHEYLLRNDAEFVQPYVDRYASGSFTDAENEWLSGAYYRPEYIIKIAKTVVSD